ncbi:MAG TPA: FlgD immunoglobulin-like domain containing protein, partial [Gemmatimonadota bacterium]|nr:FlgD immunoglobulin-like domain containing protein [Gemmatimonadota bacterium]
NQLEPDMVKRAICFAATVVLSSLWVGLTPGSAQAQLFQGPAQGTSSPGSLQSTGSFPVVPPSLPFEDQRAPKHYIELLPDPGGQPPALGPLGSNEQDDLSRLLFRAPGVRAPGLVSDFQGITQTSFIPPDPIVAAGPNHLMALVNTAFAIFNKTGTNLQQINARQWFANVSPGNNAFDPKVFYDHFADRWVMVWIAGDFSTYSEILISVSDDADPTGDWCNFALRGDLNGSTSDSTGVDYQGVGFDENAVYVVPNQFRWSNGFFAYVKLRIVPKSSLYDAGCPAVTWTDFWDLRDPVAASVPVATVRPAQTFGTPGVEYLMNDSRFEPGTNMTLWSLTNPLNPSPTLSAVAVSTTARSAPPDADQLGGSSTLIDVGGNRVRNVVYRDGSVWTAHSVADASGLYARARYVRIDVMGPTVLEDVAFGSDGCWLYYPAITADANNNMVMVYNQSCTDEYIGIRYTGRTPADVALQPSATLKAGEANYVRTGGDGRNRWGDYNGVAVDPADGNRVWLFAEYAASPSSRWGTWFGQVIPRTLGDINDDDNINVADLVLLVDFVLERDTPDPLEFISADCTPDGTLDIGDIVCLVNLILGAAPTPLLAAAPAASNAGELARLSEAAADPITGQRTVLLEAELGAGVAGLQARIAYDPGRVRPGAPLLIPRGAGLELVTHDLGDELILLIYGPSGETLAGGEGPLVRLPVQSLAGSGEDELAIELMQVRLANRSGQVRQAAVGAVALTALPARFRLSEPSSNPVGRSGTSLELEIPEPIGPAFYGDGAAAPGAVRVVVEIFNVRGQKIRTVLAEDLVAGKHTIRWDGRSDRGELVGAGLYVLRARAGAAVETRKLIVSNR